MISSTLRIISAASVAESKTACLTLNASKIPRCAISPTCQNINCHQESTKEATLFIYLVILMGRLHIISLEPTTSLAHPPPRNHKKGEANSWTCRQQLQFKQIETKKQRPKLWCTNQFPSRAAFFLVKLKLFSGWLAFLAWPTTETIENAEIFFRKSISMISQVFLFERNSQKAHIMCC